MLGGDARSLSDALAMHEAALGRDIQDLVGKVDKVRAIRADLARGRMPDDGELTRLLAPAAAGVAFNLPWPWDGEWFEWRDIRPLNYIIGSLGSGKTRLAHRLADALPSAAFIGLDRLDDGGAAAFAALRADPALKARVERTAAWLADEGATASAALTVLLAGLEADGVGALVVDMIEQDLDQPTQAALIACLRQRARADGMRPLFMLTRSSAILTCRPSAPTKRSFCVPRTIARRPASHRSPAHRDTKPWLPVLRRLPPVHASHGGRRRVGHRNFATNNSS